MHYVIGYFADLFLCNIGSESFCNTLTVLNSLYVLDETTEF